MTIDKTPRRMTMDEAITHAQKAYRKGHFAETQSVANQVLTLEPNNLQALTLLGAAHTALGDHAAAADAIGKAITLRPKHAILHANLCEMLRRNGDLDAAVAAGREAVALAPDSATALSNLGVALYERGDLDGAEAYQRRALVKEPNLPTALNNLGSILRDRKDPEGAIQFYERAHAANPSDDEILNNLGQVLVEAQRNTDAIALLTPRARKPNAPIETHLGLGRALLALDRLDEAETCFRIILQKDATHLPGTIGLAKTIQQKNQTAIALEVAERALTFAPESATAHHLKGVLLGELGRGAEAKAQYQKALEIEPDHMPAVLSLGYHCLEMGDSESARAQFETVIAGDGRDFAGHLGLARIDKLTREHTTFQRLLEEAAHAEELPARQAVALHYALGKAYEDIQEHDESFRHYARGAALKRSMVRHDPARFTQVVDQIIETFNAERIAALREAHIDSGRSIFVLGMPRSGTTLTETVIASHPAVHGGGELRDWSRLLPTDTTDPARQFPLGLIGQSMHAWHDIAKAYDQSVAALAGEHPFITDKMPANFTFLGVIHALLPNAKIVHVVRDPVDTCLSCFTRLFDKSQYHTYDQIELGTYYNNYRRLMNHWRRVLPDTAFYDCHYESLVQHFEPEARALIDWCGLSWDPACLTPHKTERSVRTASVTQVREPIYQSSVQKWRRVEAHLKPLLDTLGDNATL